MRAIPKSPFAWLNGLPVTDSVIVAATKSVTPLTGPVIQRENRRGDRTGHASYRAVATKLTLASARDATHSDVAHAPVSASKRTELSRSSSEPRRPSFVRSNQ